MYVHLSETVRERGDAMEQRLPISEAAEKLGLSLDVARKQVQRGQLPAEKVGNRWYVLMDQVEAKPSETISDPSQTDAPLVSDRIPDSLRPERDGELAALREFLDSKERDIEFLRSELTARTEELRRKDIIIADLTQRLPRLAALPAPEEPVPQPKPKTAEPPMPSRGWTRVWRMLFPA
jgi:excisionase family DNA binding protein